jgi:general stress protein YciG
MPSKSTIHNAQLEISSASAAAAALGRKGGRATGRAKLRGGATAAERAAYYARIGRKGNKAQGKRHKPKPEPSR